MAKPKGVVKLRHRKEPHLEVHLFEDQETGKVKGHLVNWKKAQVTAFEEENSPEKQEGGLTSPP